MRSLSERIELLAELGHYLRSGGDEGLEVVIQQAYMENRWFTPENTQSALSAIATSFLDAEKLRQFADTYALPEQATEEMTVGLVMAGNIPLVGFHDWLCVFLAGHRAKVKLSDKDKRLLPFLVKKMGEWAHESWAHTQFLDETEHLRGYDAVIATGSNNTARYFEQYFKGKPNIIRRNRNAVAVLDGTEAQADFVALSRDMFTYFGLGCRNVSKLYVPQGYNFEPLLEALHEGYKEIIHHDKYKNNFDYNFTLFILNNIPHLNNGCLILKEDESLTSRIASAHYAYYTGKAELDDRIGELRDGIQCVVTKDGQGQLGGISLLHFGQTQSPSLTDYPDGVDVMQFLIGCSMQSTTTTPTL
jgi:hypothetical protein